MNATLKHDLKNQLGIILGFIELLIEDTPETDGRRADMIEVRDAARACLALVDEESDRETNSGA